MDSSNEHNKHCPILGHCKNVITQTKSNSYKLIIKHVWPEDNNLNSFYRVPLVNEYRNTGMGTGSQVPIISWKGSYFIVRSPGSDSVQACDNICYSFSRCP